MKPYILLAAMTLAPAFAQEVITTSKAAYSTSVPDERDLMQQAERMTFDDASLAREVVRRVNGVSDDDPVMPNYLEIMAKSREWILEPVSQPGPFNFGDPAHFQRGLDWFARATSKRITRSNPLYVYFNRSSFGIKRCFCGSERR